MPEFIPEFHRPTQLAVPFFEDAATQQVAGRGTEKPVDTLRMEVISALERLGAFQITLIPGTYPGTPLRYGFQIHFRYGNVRGRIDCAALPLRKETTHKKDRALAQALYLLRDRFLAAYHALLYEPGALPLVPYLIGTNNKTVTETLAATGDLPALPAPRME